MSDGDKTITVGVGAVVFKGDEILLIRRGKPPFKGQWSIPGGALDHGEKIEDAVRREVLEETGVEIAIGGLIGVFEALPAETGSARHVVMVDYWAEWKKGAPVAGDDALDAEFAPIEEALSRLSWDETRRAVADALKLRNRDTGRP